MFGGILRRWKGTRGFDGLFGGCLVWIDRLGKEIGFHQIPGFLSKTLRLPIFSSSLSIHAQ
jgi:hypothetical protein